MEKNGKLFGKLNIIDLGVILVVLIAAVGICVRLFGAPSAAVKSSVDFEYVIRVENIRQFSVEALQKKGTITDKKSKEKIGEIVDIKVEPAEFQSITANGSVVMTKLPERYTCYVTIRSNGKEATDGYFTSDNTELSVGRNFEIYSKNIKTAGNIESIKKL